MMKTVYEIFLQLILMLTSVNFNGTRLCDQFSVTDLFTVQNAEDVRQLERVLCGVDMNVLNQEILNSAQLDGIDDVVCNYGFTNWLYFKC